MQLRPKKLVTNDLDIYDGTSNRERAKIVQCTDNPRKFSKEPKHRGISVVILNKDRLEFIAPLIKSLIRQKRLCEKQRIEIQLLIGDTGTRDPQVLALYDEMNGQCTVIKGLKYHFAALNNLISFNQVHCTNILFLNNDISFPEEKSIFCSMFSHMEQRSSPGILGACLWYPDGRLQHGGIDFFRDGSTRCLPFHLQYRKEVPWVSFTSPGVVPAVTGACLMISSSLFQIIGGMKESYAVECQDIDLCLSARRLGFSCECINFGPIIHVENGTRPKGEENWSDRFQLLRRWGSFIEAHII